MAEAILDALGPVLTRWTVGGSAVPIAPAAWREALGADTGEAELRLLALSGQFLGTLAVVEPSGDVQPLADIPTLAQPPLPDPLRPRARRLLLQLREPAARRNLLDFLDARGWTLHPGDWLPRPAEDVPQVYAAWQDWASAAGASSQLAEVLTAENWDHFGPAARLAAFTALRRLDPAAASVLLGEKIAGETPDHRVRLLEALASKLSDADRPLLESLAGDRAPRVKALAASLMARLGRGGAGGEDAAELAGFFPLQTKGLLRRTRVIVPQPLKLPAQRQRRSVLFETLSFEAFARAIEMSPEELIEAWQWGSDGLADLLVVAMAERSASDTIVAAITEALTTGDTSDPDLLAPLLSRLPPAQRREAALRVLRAKGASFAMALTIAGGNGEIDEAMRTPAGAALLGAVRAEDARAGDHAPELLALGLLASQAGARQALDQLAAAGLIASDPRLDMLRLNAGLEHRGAMP